MSLADYGQNFLGALSSYLGYSPTDIGFAVTDVLEDMNLSTEADITTSNTKEAHLRLKVKILEKCLNDLSPDYQISTDGNSYNRQQVFDMVSKRLQLAYGDLQQFLTVNEIGDTEIILEKEKHHTYHTHSSWSF